MEHVEFGSTCEVIKVRTASGGLVIKLPCLDLQPDLQKFRNEAQILERLGQQHGIVRYMGPLGGDPTNGLVLKQARHGDLERYILTHDSSAITYDQRAKWCMQAAKALAVCHESGVLHCDLKPRNLLLDDDQELLLCDFGSGSLEGIFEGLGLPDHGFFDPTQDDLTQVTINTELFGLGSVMYFILTGTLPHGPPSLHTYEELEAYGILFGERLKQNNMPRLEGEINEVIHACWQRKFSSAAEVVSALTGIAPPLLPDPKP